MKTKSKHCLVTGGAGFIGSHVVDGLIKKGHKVTVIDNFRTGKEKNLNFDADLIIEDILKLDWNSLPKFDYVFHLVAIPRVQYSIDYPMETHETNVMGTLKVLEYCKVVGAKLIFSSSSSVYGSDSKTPLSENADKNPKSPYALHKYTCEQYIKLYSKLFGLEYCILRYFNVFGERAAANGAYPLVVAAFLDQKSKGLPLTITGTGNNRRDYTYVKDVARANILAMDWHGGEYNIGAGKSRSVNDIAHYVGGRVTYIPARLGEPKYTEASITKALNDGWKPTVDVKEWIRENRN